MEVDEVTEFIKKILGKCEALAYCKYFKGISEAKFKSYSFEDFKSLLPSTEEGELAAAEIKSQIELALMMERVKAEKRAGGDVSSFFQAPEVEAQGPSLDDSRIGVDEINVNIVPQQSKEIEVVTLDSDEDVDEPQDYPESCASLDEDSTDSEDLSKSESSDKSDDDGPRPKRKRHVELALTTGRPVRACWAKKHPIMKLGHRETSTYTCRTEEGTRDQPWYDDIHGVHCTTINAYEWCWQPLSHRCTFNLFRILNNCPNVEKLNLFSDVADTPANIELPEGSLPKLKKLLVNRHRNMDIGNLLRTILMGTTNLKDFSYKFSTETEEDLELLGNFDWSKLQRLTIASCSSPSYLKKAQIEKLLLVRAPKLRTLRMGLGLYEDVSGDLLENVFMNFPTLQNLSIPGQYYSHTEAHPVVTIDFPNLSQLKYLYLGGKYGYAAALRTDKDNESITLERESMKPFHVTLKFCRILRNLKTLILGKMYNVDSLHLSSFPKLEVLRIGSPWHLSVIFPEKNARSNNYPLITDLQLPDGLNDASFVREISERFPKIKACRIYLPSARVLRTFFNVMKDAGLKELRLKTQFDFSSTLESCLLDRVLPINRSSEDLQKVMELETHARWNEFVNQHNITLPLRTDAEVQAFVEATGEYGLGALKLLDLFYLKHLPRILHLPQVESNEAATTTTTKLGYTEYPISSECCDAVRRIATRFCWNFKEPAGERERWIEANYGSASDFETTDDERTEIEAGSVIHYANLKEESKEEED